MIVRAHPNVQWRTIPTGFNPKSRNLTNIVFFDRTFLILQFLKEAEAVKTCGWYIEEDRMTKQAMGEKKNKWLSFIWHFLKKMKNQESILLNSLPFFMDLAEMEIAVINLNNEWLSFIYGVLVFHKFKFMCP